MKKVLMMTFVVIVMFFFGAKAQASYWSLSPTGALDTAIGDDVGFDLSLTIEAGDADIWAVSMALDFGFDDNELVYKTTEIPSPGGTIYEPVAPGLWLSGWEHFVPLSVSADMISMNIFAPLSQTFGTQLVADNTYDIATLYFTVINDQTWDTLADVTLFDQVGNKGVAPWSSDGMAPFINLTGAEGADVGSPAAVPVPGAIWLLGSGLLGLVTIRRRRVTG